MPRKKTGKESAEEFREHLERVGGITNKDPYLGLSRAIFLLDKYNEDAQDYVAKRRIIQNCFLLGLVQWFEKNSILYEQKDIEGFLENIANRKKFLSNTLQSGKAKNRHLLESQKIFYDTVTTAIDGILARKEIGHLLARLKEDCERMESNYASTLWLKKKIDEFGKGMEEESGQNSGRTG